MRVSVSGIRGDGTLGCVGSSYNVEVTSANLEGACEIINQLVDDSLALEQLSILVVDVSLGDYAASHQGFSRQLHDAHHLGCRREESIRGLDGTTDIWIRWQAGVPNRVASCRVLPGNLRARIGRPGGSLLRR